MAVYNCLTCKPEDPNLEWHVCLCGTVCCTKTREVNIQNDTIDLTSFTVKEDCGKIYHCYISGTRSKRLSPYLTEGTHVTINGKAKATNLNLINVLKILFEEEEV